MAKESRVAYGVKILNSRHKDIQSLKRAGNIAEMHGNKFWNSSFLIMDYLKKHPLKKKVRILEIGCGWGLLGIYCAKQFDARVTGVDIDKNVLAYMDLHAKINKVDVVTSQCSFEQLTTKNLQVFDIIVGADICYWDEMTKLLLNLIARAKKAGVKQIIIADPCRQPFTDLAELCKKKYKNVSVEEKFLKRPVPASGEILILS
ncbi:MAG: methyltransferase domain-containing protein [Pseudomonadales bacterium]|nr:methyltransferase domain-containing protein [Pseudomonadales bacterium]